MLDKLKLWWREWSWIIYLAVFVLSLVLIAIKNDERVFMKNYKVQCDTQELFAVRGKVYSCKMYKQDSLGEVK